LKYDIKVAIFGASFMDAIDTSVGNILVDPSKALNGEYARVT
jgi:hypothetical protein